MTKTNLESFRLHLESQNLSRTTVYTYVRCVRRFLDFIGNQRIDRVSEQQVKEFFARYKKLKQKTGVQAASVISQYVKFATAGLPVVVEHMGAAMPPARAKPSKKEMVLRRYWIASKRLHEKEAANDLIAKLARKVSDHYLYFQSRLRGGDEDLDEVGRLADECRELIESNLALFMALSASGRNVHPKINERMRRWIQQST